MISDLSAQLAALDRHLTGRTTAGSRKTRETRRHSFVPSEKSSSLSSSVLPTPETHAIWTGLKPGDLTCRV